MDGDVEFQVLLAKHPRLPVDLQLPLAQRGVHAINLALFDRQDVVYDTVYEMWCSGGDQIRSVIFDSDNGWEPFLDGRQIQQPDRATINRYRKALRVP